MAASNTVGFLLVAGAALLGVEAVKGFPSVGGGGSSSSGGGSGGSLDTGGGFAPGGVPLPAAGPWVNTVVSWANAHGIDPAFPLAMIAQESHGSPTAHALTAKEDSWGWLQINLKVHSPAGPGASYAQNVACAKDIACSLRYWGTHIASGYAAAGGNSAFHAGPTGFLQRVVPGIQGSIGWTAAQAQAAYAAAQHWLAGGQ